MIELKFDELESAMIILSLKNRLKMQEEMLNRDNNSHHTDSENLYEKNIFIINNLIDKLNKYREMMGYKIL